MLLYKKLPIADIKAATSDVAVLQSVVRVIGDSIFTQPYSITSAKFEVQNASHSKVVPLELSGGGIIFSPIGDSFAHTPPYGKYYIYLKNNGLLYKKNSLGVETIVGGGDTIITKEIIGDTIIVKTLIVSNTSSLSGTVAINGIDLPLANQKGDSDELIPTNSELFSLNTIDQISNRNRKPAIKNLETLPSIYEYTSGDTIMYYNSLWNKWNDRNSFGIFKAATNLVLDPEDLTTANWTNEGSGDSLSGYYFNGRRFTKIFGNNTYVYSRVRQTITFATAGVYSLQVMFKKGYVTSTDANTQFVIGVYGSVDGINYGTFYPKWDKSGYWGAVGKLIKQDWYDDICELKFITSYCPAGIYYIYVASVNRGSVNIASTEYGYATAVQVEKNNYPTPYTSTYRTYNQEFAYSFANRPTGAIEFWFRPWGVVGSKNFHLWNIRGSGSSYIDFRINEFYQSSLYLDGSNYRIAGQQGFYDKVTNPAAPVGVANDVVFSATNYFMAVAHLTTPFISIYKKMTGDTFSKVTTAITAAANSAYGISFLGDSYVAVACNTTTPYLNTYKRKPVGDTIFLKCTTQPTAAPGSLNDCAFSRTGYYIGAVGGTIPYLTIWKRFGGDSVYIKDTSNIDTALTGTGTGVDWLGDTFVAAAHSTTPFVSIYKRMGATSPGDSDFNKCTNPTILPTGNATAISFSGTGAFLAVAHTSNPYITIYKKSGDTTWVKICNPEILPTGDAYGCKFVGDTYLYVSHKTTPWVTIYKRTGDSVFCKIINPTTLPGDTGFSAWASSTGSYYVAAHLTSPYINIFKKNANTEILALNGDTLRSWHHAKIWWDIPNQFIKMRIDGSSTVYTNNLTAGTVTSLSPTPILHIGSADAGFGDSASSDCQITDLLVWPTGDSTITHYTKNRPYYTSETLLGEDGNWKVDNFGNWTIGNDSSTTMTVGKDLTLDGRTNIPASKLYIGGTYLPTIDHLLAGDELVE